MIFITGSLPIHFRKLHFSNPLSNLNLTLQDLGPFGPEVAATEASGFVSANSNCGGNARSYYEEYEANGSRYIITSGVPNHPAECGAPLTNPNVRCS